MNNIMKISEKINDYLKKYDLVQMIIEDSKTENLTKFFLKSEALKKTSKKLLILSCTDIPYTSLYGHEYHKLSYDEQDAIQRFYTMYEFSDRFRVLSDDQRYGGLLNYVKTGVMTMEEVFQVMLT